MRVGVLDMFACPQNWFVAQSNIVFFGPFLADICQKLVEWAGGGKCGIPKGCHLPMPPPHGYPGNLLGLKSGVTVSQLILQTGPRTAFRRCISRHGTGGAIGRPSPDWPRRGTNHYNSTSMLKYINLCFPVFNWAPPYLVRGQLNIRHRRCSFLHSMPYIKAYICSYMTNIFPFRLFSVWEIVSMHKILCIFLWVCAGVCA